MTNEIRITPDQMRERASQYRVQANTVNDVIRSMDTLLQQLLTEWAGTSSDAYAVRYEQLKPEFQKAEALIHEIAKALDSAAKLMEDADVSGASMFNA